MNKRISSSFAIAVIIIVAGFFGGLVLWQKKALDSTPDRFTIERPGPVKNQKGAARTEDQIVGNDRDEHGCIGSAGYSWCEEKQKCLRSWEEACDSQSTNAKIISAPTQKLVMCMNQCGSKGESISNPMLRYPGETVQKIRACFGDINKNCPSKDVTNDSAWTTSNGNILSWSRNYTVNGDIIAGRVYPKKTLKAKGIGSATATITYKSFSYSLTVNCQQVP